MDESSNGYFSPRRKAFTTDYTTNFFDISQLPDKLSSMVVIHVKHPYSKYGIPNVIINDNGPEFTAKSFKMFSEQCDLKSTLPQN